ncbi:hypothetical protein ElyMa_002566000 [Elysia marginata]|uniref:Uncharacterized protein n=1 Tax=Elysia marginata TaxID=1093978 RepID=A0AAV4GY08_9GAST|nr:hypothetical protein ElyMa_002566000 [Elysia marginata]
MRVSFNWKRETNTPMLSIPAISSTSTLDVLLNRRLFGIADSDCEISLKPRQAFGRLSKFRSPTETVFAQQLCTLHTFASIGAQPRLAHIGSRS